jgi:dihydropteroate synthase
MGIVNVTPDSFSDGGRFAAVDAAVAHASALIEDGADIIDIGGESTRPGAAPIPPGEEQARVLPIVKALAETAARRGRLLSVDTRHAATMAAAIAAGATMVNDVSALADPGSRRIVAESGLPVVLMHMQGEPRTMQLDPCYDDAVAEVAAGLAAARDRAVAAGIRPDRIWLDPGIGFGKRPQHNLALLRSTERLRALGHPLLVGVSRKNFVGRIERVKEPGERVSESVAAALAVAARSASALRVHDVAETRKALAVWSAIEGEPLG